MLPSEAHGRSENKKRKEFLEQAKAKMSTVKMLFHLYFLSVKFLPVFFLTFYLPRRKLPLGLQIRLFKFLCSNHVIVFTTFNTNFRWQSTIIVLRNWLLMLCFIVQIKAKGDGIANIPAAVWGSGTESCCFHAGKGTV